MNTNQKRWIIIIPLLVAWLFDLLFWKKSPGVSFPLIVTITIAGGWILARREKLQPTWQSALLAIPAVFFSIMTVFRLEPLTLFLNVLLTLVSLTILALSFTGGKWWNYSIGDYITRFFELIVSLLTRLFTTLSRKSPGTGLEDATPAASRVKQASTGKAVLRGILIAIPLILLLAALLSSADPIFDTYFSGLLAIFKFENLGELLFRLFYIIILAYLLAGAYLHALQSSADRKLIGIDTPGIPRFLGWIESSIILAGINLLFIFFISIQFRYFFGGQSNIHISGYTYAEYARRGFGELVAVAVITLLIMQVLNSIVAKKDGHESGVFTGLSTLMVLLVIVILVSAFQRLQLYEAAYGFSRLRTYTHVFLIWTAILLVATAGLEVVRRSRLFPLAVFIAVIGFTASLNFVNVDRFIAGQNIRREMSSVTMDVSYLMTLTNDAVPVLAREFNNPQVSPARHDLIGVTLACKEYYRAGEDAVNDPEVWVSYNHSLNTGNRVLQKLAPQLNAYRVKLDEYESPFIQVDGEQLYCERSTTLD